MTLNANGWRLFAHLVSFFGQPLLFEKTQEFNSPDFHVLNGKLFLYALLIILTGLALTRRRPTRAASLRPARESRLLAPGAAQRGAVRA